MLPRVSHVSPRHCVSRVHKATVWFYAMQEKGRPTLWGGQFSKVFASFFKKKRFLPGSRRQGRQLFFFEKKNQKTFAG
jgi:hypothetical protein